MSAIQLDCRGLACPGPVLRAKEAIEGNGAEAVTVLVDNPAARENVSRFLGRFGFCVDVAEREGDIAVTGRKPESGASACEIMPEENPGRAETKILVLIGTDRLGRGDDELGRKLVFNFVGTLKEMGHDLWRVVLLNGGVKLAVEGSDVLAGLQDLENEGTRLLVCGTCLNHFGILEKKRAGETTNMLDIVTAMQLADKVISLT